tara:strand:+ start:196 stop:1062 length:867 start_codon:yes stop_codon:yes gene_type:complete
MKKYHYFFLSLFTLFLITSATVKTNESKRLFEKTIFVEVSFNEDSVLFKPLSKAWSGHWNILSADISFQGSSLMNSDKYKRSFKDRTDNLWTVLHPMIINGTIQSYCPYNPETYGLGLWDDGELKYPLMDQEKNESFLTSEKARENLCFLLGRLGPQSDIPLVNQYGEDSVTVLSDGTAYYLYAAPRYYWYKDRDIVKYKLRVSILFNKNGIEKKRVIKSIAPVVYEIEENADGSTSITGTRELLWLDFKELKPILKKAYYFDEDMKSVSYLNYFQQKAYNAALKANE